MIIMLTGYRQVSRIGTDTQGNESVTRAAAELFALVDHSAALNARLLIPYFRSASVREGR